MSSQYSFEWNYSRSMIIKRKGFGKELNKYFAERVAKYSIPFVPFDTGSMNNSVTTRATEDHGTVTYRSPYVGYQYTGENGSGVPESAWNRNRNVHPLATSFWDQAMWTNYGNVIGKELNKKREELSKP